MCSEMYLRNQRDIFEFLYNVFPPFRMKISFSIVKIESSPIINIDYVIHKLC